MRYLFLAALVAACRTDYDNAPVYTPKERVVEAQVLRFNYIRSNGMTRIHDDSLNVTCYIYSGISCIPDSQLRQPAEKP